VDGEGAVAEPAACLEPKMADTMLPKTLIFSSYVALALRPAPRLPRRPGRRLRPSGTRMQVKERLARANELIA
jgi:hypothetical protein